MPPSHFPRCSVTDIFSEVFRQSDPGGIFPRGSFVLLQFQTPPPYGVRGPAAFGAGAAKIASLPGRPYRPPLRRAINLVRRAGCPHPAKPGQRDHQACNHRSPAMAACGHAALRGSPKVRQKSQACSGGYTIRPYGVRSAWCWGLTSAFLPGRWYRWICGRPPGGRRGTPGRNWIPY